jgi:hypothetical protein
MEIPMPIVLVNQNLCYLIWKSEEETRFGVPDDGVGGTT